MIKEMFIDVETTGTNPYKNGLFQLSGMLEVGGEVVDRFNYKMTVFEKDVIESEALKVTGVSVQEIKNFKNHNEVFSEFISLLDRTVDKFKKEDKIFFIGFNANFDDGFLRAWFAKHNHKYYGSYFFWPPIDVAVLATMYLKQERAKMPDFKLVTVAKQLGIDVDASKTHDASYDIELTRGIYQKVWR